MENREDILLTEDVTVDQLRELLPPMSEIKCVETNRLKDVRKQMLRLMDPSSHEHERSIEEQYLRHMGAGALLAHIEMK